MAVLLFSNHIQNLFAYLQDMGLKSPFFTNSKFFQFLKSDLPNFCFPTGMGALISPLKQNSAMAEIEPGLQIGARVEPFEFTSNSMGEVGLSSRVKMHIATFHELMFFGLTHYGDYSILRAKKSKLLSEYIAQKDILWTASTPL
jgi:hypothetical protein